MSLKAFPVPGSGSSFRCEFCRRVTRIKPQHGEREGALTLAPRSPPCLMVPASYPRLCGKKRALLMGVNYTGRSHQLEGCLNDVRAMRHLLCHKFGFPSDAILELTAGARCETEKEEPWMAPTRENLLRAMRWLVDGTSCGDSLVFHFSGHGTQKPDLNGDEVDGYNEALCPLDVEESGKILDDEINETIVRPLGPGVKLHAIADTCHSGTMLDLPYLCRQSRYRNLKHTKSYFSDRSKHMSRQTALRLISSVMGYWQWENHCNAGMAPKRPSGGLAISISSCRDDQKCDETTGEWGSMGIMTASFIKAVEDDPGTTYGRLLRSMRARISDEQGNRRLRGRLGSFVRRMIMPGSVQEPQLCSSEAFDIYQKPFLL
ncbi:hypothetical protein PR202_gn00032 [Eleusine coracana subsp. coracana]|uniref:Peptidase C14 caspase domain-containing protein n=1 Tax=Eleusine coracana subsp. coracana TaxID=191504 RepID=A0AAV5G0D3_ELECO|nr:hypothetical protein PR202_gb20092 [Eleusine coracana subsp. coracana]GJN40736.1 hypothetical protein PR202_gn00032 [Eleusine coracana subsp. coracana]